MDATLIIIIAVVVVGIVVVAIGAYIWSAKRLALLSGIMDDAREKLSQKYSEDQVSKILEPLEDYVNPVSLQLAIDLYLRYDNQEGVTKIVESIGKKPSTELVHHIDTLASGIDDFGHFDVACYATAPRWSAEDKVRLANKYQDLDTYKKILGFEVWVGQTEDQVRDALGDPLAVDEKVLKTKTKYVWKYDQLGTNRYAKRVTIENGVVVGFDIKG